MPVLFWSSFIFKFPSAFVRACYEFFLYFLWSLWFARLSVLSTCVYLNLSELGFLSQTKCFYLFYWLSLIFLYSCAYLCTTYPPWLSSMLCAPLLWISFYPNLRLCVSVCFLLSISPHPLLTSLCCCIGYLCTSFKRVSVHLLSVITFKPLCDLCVFHSNWMKWGANRPRGWPSLAKYPILEDLRLQERTASFWQHCVGERFEHGPPL